MRIYIAGPYTGPTEAVCEQNTHAAIDAAIKLFRKGHFPYVPHLTHYVDRRARQTGAMLGWEDYINWDSAWLELCDAILYIGKSKGADLELEMARKLGKALFFSVEEVPEVRQLTA